MRRAGPGGRVQSKGMIFVTGGVARRPVTPKQGQ